MNGIIINVDPIAFSIAGWEIGWYPITILIAIFAALLITLNESVKRGLPKEQILSLLPWMLLAGIVGARLFHVVDRWEIYRSNPAAIFALQQGGLAIWGAVAGGMIATFIFAKTNKIIVGKLFDVVVPGLITAQIIGRVGCIINGDAYGDPTSLPWGFIYNNPGSVIPDNLKGIPTHPYPVYEMIWNAISLFFLLWIRKRFKFDGTLFIVYLIVYSVGRFLLTFVRQEKVWLLGLQEAQLLSILTIIVSITIYFTTRRKYQVKMVN